MEIDERIQYLVDVLNSLNSIATFSSCGGHENPEGSQVSADRFTVSIEVEPDEVAFQSLAVIAAAIDAMSNPNDVTLTPWLNGENPFEDPLDFSLDGRNNADPDALADAILQWQQIGGVV